MEIKKIKKLNPTDNILYILEKVSELSTLDLSKEELSYLKKNLKADQGAIRINKLSHHVFVLLIKPVKDYLSSEKIRKEGSHMEKRFNKLDIQSITISANSAACLLFVEGMALSNYQFLKYFTDKKTNSLKTVKILGSATAKELASLETVTRATSLAKDLVNEPLSYLTAVQLSKEIKGIGKEAGFKVEVFNKSKIEALKILIVIMNKIKKKEKKYVQNLFRELFREFKEEENKENVIFLICEYIEGTNSLIDLTSKSQLEEGVTVYELNIY